MADKKPDLSKAVVLPQSMLQTRPSPLPGQRQQSIANAQQTQLNSAQIAGYRELLGSVGRAMAAFTHQPGTAPEDQLSDSPLNSFLSGVATVADNVFPDDISANMGPVGPLLSAGVANYQKAADATFQGASWGLSALPGGIKTLDWDRAGQLSPARILAAMGVTEKDWVAYSADKRRWDYLNDKSRSTDLTPAEKEEWNSLLQGGEFLPNSGLPVPQGWDIAKPEDEQWLFGNTNAPNVAPPHLSKTGIGPNATMSNLATGLADAAFNWYLDPMVVAGKAIKVARLGTELADIGGKTVRYVSRESVARDIDKSTAEAIDYFSSGGVEGKRNWMAVMAENGAKRSGKQLENEPEFRSSPYKDELLDIADKIDEPVLYAKFIAAATGRPQYIAELFDEAPAIADAMSGLRRANPYEFTGLNKPLGALNPPLLTDFLEAGIDSNNLVDDLVRRNEALQKAVGLLGTSHAPIQQLGTTMTTGKEIAQAWRAGKAAREAARRGRKIAVKGGNVTDDVRLPSPFHADAALADLTELARVRLAWGSEGASEASSALSNAAAVGSAEHSLANELLPFAQKIAPSRFPNSVPLTGTMPGVTETVFQLSANFRKVAVWEWANKQRGSGWLEIRGPGAGRSSEEWRASISDSRVIRNMNPEFIDYIEAKWRALPPSQRIAGAKALEDEVVVEIARLLGLDKDGIAEARKMYAVADKQREAVILKLRSNVTGDGHAYAIDPEDGTVVIAGQNLRSQLETRMPIIDFRVMDRLLTDLAKPENKPHLNAIGDYVASALGVSDVPKAHLQVDKLSEQALHAADQILSAWKAAVLIRAGYPMRNTAEGWLRTLPVLAGLPQLTPSAVVKGAGRLVTNAVNAGARKGLDKSMLEISKIIDSQQRLMNRTVTEGDRIVKILREDAALDPALRMSTARRAKYESVLTSYENDYLILEAQLDDYRGVVDSLAAQRADKGKKFIGWDEAYTGEMGELTAARASAQVNVQNFFETQATRDMLLGEEGLKWEQIDVPTLPASVAGATARGYEKWLATSAGQKWQKQSARYWDSIAKAARQLRMDNFGQVLLKTDDLDEIMKFWHTPAGKSYAKDMQMLDDEDAIAAYTAKWYRVAHGYFPDAAARELALTEHAAPAQFRAMLAQREDLVPIHGPAEADQIHLPNPVSRARSAIFNVIANMPDSALVRQPFYNEVWKAEKDKMWARAIADGMDTDDPALLARIEDTARRRALAKTNETLFTIERYSNPAAMLRFVSPFFAAFENSIRAWTRIIANDPSVLPRAALLWNIPNSLGMVVDENGNKVPSQGFDFLSGSKNQYIVLPQFMQEQVMKVTGGVPFAVPKGALNVVTPGEAPLLPGAGPLVTYPVGMILAGRPDTTEFLRKMLGDDLFSQIAPFGQASSDWIDSFAPAWVRKAITVMRGEDSDDYLATMTGVTKDAIVTWQLNGGDPKDKPTYEDIKERTDQFYLFSTLASLGLPVSIMRTSKYQPQLDYWQALQEQEGSFDEKIGKFLDKFGDSYAGLTLGSTESEVRGLGSSVQLFNALQNNSGAVRMLNNTIEGDVGIIAATIPSDDYVPAVGEFWLSNREPGTGGTWKNKPEPEDLLRQYQITDMWKDYRRAKAERDDAMAAYGITNITSAKARDTGIAGVWADVQQGLADKYGDIYNVYGPQSYASKTPRTLATIRTLLSDEDFMKSGIGQQPVWSDLADYMRTRQEATDAIAAGQDKGAVEAIWGDYVEIWRMRSLRTSDFYDTFLDSDTLGTDVAKVGGE